MAEKFGGKKAKSQILVGLSKWLALNPWNKIT
jgi:hypothetical protein